MAIYKTGRMSTQKGTQTLTHTLSFSHSPTHSLTHSLTAKPSCLAACATVSRGIDTLRAPTALSSANSNGKHLDAPNASAPDMAGTPPADGPTSTRRMVAAGSTPWVDTCCNTVRKVEANAHAASVSAFSQSARAGSVWVVGIAAVSTMTWIDSQRGHTRMYVWISN